MFTHSAFTPQPQGLMKPYRSKLQAIARFIDASVVFFSLFVVLIVMQYEMLHVYSWGGAIAAIVFLLFTENFEVYSLWRGARKREAARRIFAAWLCTLCVLAFAAFVLDSTTVFSRKVVGVWALTVPALIIALHVVRRKVLTWLRRSGKNSRSYAIVGATPLGVSLSNSIQQMDWLGYKLNGYYTNADVIDSSFEEAMRGDQSATHVPEDVRGFTSLLEQIHQGSIDIVYIALPMAQQERIKSVLDALADTTVSVFVVPDFSVFNPIRVRWNTVQGIPIVSLYDTPFTGIETLLKRVMDIVLGSLILALIVIPMLVIAIGIKRTSKGPVFFKQKRHGIAGKPITVWKFRSMTTEDNGPVVKQATKNDVRITPFGAFLRRTSLDELPQFINVLQGTMSIVGPRPHAAAHNDYYRTQVHGYMQRHKVKPGITGLAQVNGCRGETETNEKMNNRVKYDLQYIDSWSLWLDIKIVFMTVFKGFVGKNVY